MSVEILLLVFILVALMIYFAVLAYQYRTRCEELQSLVNKFREDAYQCKARYEELQRSIEKLREEVRREVEATLLFYFTICNTYVSTGA